MSGYLTIYFYTIRVLAFGMSNKVAENPPQLSLAMAFFDLRDKR